MRLGPDVARIAGLIGEPARAAILSALVDGRALPAGELASIGNVAAPTASFHLRKLLDASLITVVRQGRHSYYRLADDRVAAAIESIAALAPPRPQISPPREMRFARSCYRHLAGALAVEINHALIERQLVTANSTQGYRLTDRGRQWGRHLGVDLPATGKSCLDWTERRPHISGPLGVALFSALLDWRWLARTEGNRALRLTHAGARGLERALGLRIAAAALAGATL